MQKKRFARTVPMLPPDQKQLDLVGASICVRLNEAIMRVGFLTNIQQILANILNRLQSQWKVKTMIKSENGMVQIKGTGMELLKEAIAVVYSVRKGMEQCSYWVEDFDCCIKAILANKFDDNVANCKIFNSEEEFEAFKAKVAAETNTQQPTSLAEGLMRDIAEEQD